jgi:hypothetical protein
MKYLLVFLLGFAVGAYLFKYHLPFAQTPAALVGDSVNDHLQAWHLTPEDIRHDLGQTGEVVRTQATRVGDKISDARVTAVIKSKYVLDRDLSALEIHVETHDGYVALSGTAASPGLIGRAIALALDTDGVTNVTSKLAIAP